MNELTKTLLALGLMGTGALVGGEFIKKYLFHKPREDRTSYIDSKASKPFLRFAWRYIRFVAGTSLFIAGLIILKATPS